MHVRFPRASIRRRYYINSSLLFTVSVRINNQRDPNNIVSSRCLPFNFTEVGEIAETVKINVEQLEENMMLLTKLNQVR